MTLDAEHNPPGVGNISWLGGKHQGESLGEIGIFFVKAISTKPVYHDEYECDPSDRCGHHDCDSVVVCTDLCHCR